MKKNIVFCFIMLLLSFLFLVPAFAIGVRLDNNGEVVSWGNGNTSYYERAMTVTPIGDSYASLHVTQGRAFFTFDLKKTYNICDLVVYIADTHDSTYNFTVQFSDATATNANWDNGHRVLTTSKGGVTCSDAPSGNPQSLFPGNTPATNARYIRIIVDGVSAQGDLHMYAINIYRQYNTDDDEGVFYSRWGNGESGDTVTVEAGTSEAEGCMWKGGYEEPVLQSGASAYFTCSIEKRPALDNMTTDFLVINAIAYTDTPYAITVKRKSSLEYEPYTYTLYVKVSRKTTTMTLPDNDFVYDGLPKTLTATTDSNGTPSYVHYLSDGTTKTTFENSGAAIEGGAPLYAGTYQVTVSIPDTPQFTAASASGILTINKANRTLTLSTGAQETAPHILTYPFSDTFVVTATGTEEPGIISVDTTTYASFSSRPQTVTYTENFDNIAGGSMPNGYTVIVEEQSPATAGVSSGGLELRSMERDVARYLVRLPVENLLASDFVFEADVTFLDVLDQRRWVSLAYFLQDEQHLTYMQMAVRQGTTAQDGVEYAHWTGAEYWTVRKTAPYSSALATDTTHKLKVVGSGGRIQEYVDGIKVLELTDIYYAAGGFGLSVAGCYARFDNISISGSAAERTTVTTTPTASTDGVQSTTVTMAATQNYNAATVTYYYQIDKGTIHYTAEDYTGVYDGVPHGITVTVQSPDGTTVKYGTSSDAVTAESHLLYTVAGDYTEYFTIEKANYHTVSDNRKVTITPAALTLAFDADDKAYDTTAEATGTFTVTGVLAGDSVTAQAASVTFASALPGTHAVTASGITLDNKNYTPNVTSITNTATISPIENLSIIHISDAINTVNDTNMTALVHNKVTAHVPLFPTVSASSVTTYNDGTFGRVIDTLYNRHTAYTDALGVLNDSMPFAVAVNGITVASGTLYVTTGHDTVYGTNEVKPQNASYQPVQVLKFARIWEQNANAHTASIATGDATTVTFKAYLRAGEKLQVATAIGIYHGRTIVTVRENGDLLATDRIDAFFPVPYEESYIISDMNNTHYIETKNPNRGDYLDQVPEFVALHSGVYDITINVTGESYLLDAQLGLAAMYQGNSPASTPITTLASIKILHD